MPSPPAALLTLLTVLRGVDLWGRKCVKNAALFVALPLEYDRKPYGGSYGRKTLAVTAETLIALR